MEKYIGNFCVHPPFSKVALPLCGVAPVGLHCPVLETQGLAVPHIWCGPVYGKVLPSMLLGALH